MSDNVFGARQVAPGDNRPPEIAFVERLQRLEAERLALVADVKLVYREVKQSGFKISSMRQAVKRSMESDEAKSQREAVEEQRDAILARLGLL